MRVCLLTDYFPPHLGGGVERVVQELATRLVARGHRVMVITLNTDDAPPREKIDGIEVVRAGAIQLARLTGIQVSVSPGAPITAVRAIRAFRPDIIHAHSRFFFLSALAPMFKRVQRVPLVTTLHVAEVAHLKGWSRVATKTYEGTVSRFLLANSDQVTAVSEAVLRYAIGALHVDRRKLTLIANGVDIERFQPATQPRPAGAAAQVVFVGRLIYNKGPQYLVESAPAILARHPQTMFVFVGDGPMEGELRARAISLGIDHAVQFAGVTDEVPRFLRAADILVRPSLSEGMPLTVLEGMACGLPVVASTVGGNPEIVRDGVTGYLVPPGDVGALGARISDLLADDALRRAMGAAARRKVVESHSWDIAAEQTLAVYERALARLRQE